MVRDWSEIVESLDVFLTEGQGKRHPVVGIGANPDSLEPVLVEYDKKMQFWIVVNNDGTCGKCNDIVRERLKAGGLIFRDGVTTLDDISFVSKSWCAVVKKMIQRAQAGDMSATSMYSRGLGSDVLVFCSPNPTTLVHNSGDWVITWLAIDIYNAMLAKTGWHRRNMHTIPDSYQI